MKKLALLLSMALLAACGGGGTSTSTSQSASYSTDSGQLPMATMSVSIAGNEATAQQKTLALGPDADTLNPTNRLRIVVSNPNIRVNNATFKSISTHMFPTLGISYTLPVAPGYKIEAIGFRQTLVPGLNRLKRYGSATFDLTPTGTVPATVSISPAPINAQIAFAQYSTTPLGSLTAYATTAPTYKSQYNIAVSGRTSPLGTGWKLVQESADILIRNSYFGSYVTSDLLTALATPQSYSGGTIYALGEFYLDSFYLKSGESPTNFTYVYPNRYWGDPAVSQPYLAAPTAPGGGITISGGW